MQSLPPSSMALLLPGGGSSACLSFITRTAPNILRYRLQRSRRWLQSSTKPYRKVPDFAFAFEYIVPFQTLRPNANHIIQHRRRSFTLVESSTPCSPCPILSPIPNYPFHFAHQWRRKVGSRASPGTLQETGNTFEYRYVRAKPYAVPGSRQ